MSWFQSKISWVTVFVPSRVGNRREEIVRAEVLALDHSSAAENITILGRSGAIEAAAQAVQLLQNDNIPAWNFSIPDEEGGCRQRRDASSDQIDFRIVLFGG
jgi:hypothetical protein